ncbi:MAG: hypothetical protein LLF80_03365 [Porphyromonadaceae bacterium]|nr:hypothetical protein [Porphyromonadaceae bacterium]
MGYRECFQYVDPEVTKIKFEQELKEFRELENEYRKKGVICYKITSLSINLIFAVPHLKPQPIAFAVNIDYTNWDVEPPSITFVDPFTDKVLQREEVKIKFFQVKDKNAIKIVNGQIAEPDLLQPGNPPFFCIPGVKEYHAHAAHSGDSWMLHRKQGEGKLCVLIDQLYSHSIAQSSNFVMSINIGFNEAVIGPDVNKLKL